MNYSRLTDHEKWSRFKEGDFHVLSLIYNEYSKSLCLYGLKFTQDLELVEDTLQDLFIDLIKNHRKLGETDNILFYLLKSFKRKLIRNLRKEKHSGIIITAETYTFNITYSIERKIIIEEHLKEKTKLLMQGLKKLTPRQKEIIYLKFTKELAYHEISELMNISIEACRNLVAKAVKKLKETVKEKNGMGMLLFLFFERSKLNDDSYLSSS